MNIFVFRRRILYLRSAMARGLLFTIQVGYSWKFKLLLPPVILARLARFLGKEIKKKKEDLPHYYLAENEDGIWRKPNDKIFKWRIGGSFSRKLLFNDSTSPKYFTSP